MASAQEIWNKIKGAFAGGEPTGTGLECTHLYASVGTTVGVEGFSIPKIAKVAGVNVERAITAIAHGLRLLDDYQYAVCQGYRSVYSKLSTQEQLELQNELQRGRTVIMAVSAGLIALGLTPENKDIAAALSEILSRIAKKALEIESAAIPHFDSPDMKVMTTNLMDDIGVTERATIDIGKTTFKEKLTELAREDEKLSRICVE
jgi:hypothetical protein